MGVIRTRKTQEHERGVTNLKNILLHAPTLNWKIHADLVRITFRVEQNGTQMVNFSIKRL